MGIQNIRFAKNALNRLSRAIHPTISDVCVAENKGLSAFLNGKMIELPNGYARIPGVRHVITASRFPKELQQMSELSGRYSESAIAQCRMIETSIPERLKPVFEDLYLCDQGHLSNTGLIKSLSKGASDIRYAYDMVIDKPIAKIRSGVYFGWKGLKDKLGGLFRKRNAGKDIDIEHFKNLLESNFIKVPENLSKSEFKEYLVNTLRKCNYNEKEIQAILDKKPLTFYRFVGETELRAMKNGANISSTAKYNINNNWTDITTNPDYKAFPEAGVNNYRITFKPKSNWNPFVKNSDVQMNDITSAKYRLLGGYSKADVLCTERVRR